jgi:hypothetical protein
VGQDKVVVTFYDHFDTLFFKGELAEMGAERRFVII